MSENISKTDYRPVIDQRLDAVLEPDTGARMLVARETIAEFDDRWYGRLLLRSAASVDGPVDEESILPAAVAIELIRGYVRLRCELQIQLANDIPHSFSRNPTSALIGSDFLYSAAYTTLGESRSPEVSACLETFAVVTENVIETLARNPLESASSTADLCTIVDETAGSIGSGAARIGATLAGADSSQEEHFATLGRGLGIARLLARKLDSEHERNRVALPELDEETCRQHAKRHVSKAETALGELRPVAEAEPFRPLFAEIELHEG